MNKKVLFLDHLPMDSDIRVGSQRYAALFRKNGYEVFSLSHYVNIYMFIKRDSQDRELISAWRKGPKTTADGIIFYSPLCLVPYINLPVLSGLHLGRNCLNYCYPGLKKVLQDKGFVDIDVLFINNIRLISVLKFVKPKIIMLRISDRIERFENVPANIATLQEEVIKIADAVFVTSRNLQEEVGRINKNTFYLPNGTDKAFIMETGKNYPYPREYNGHKKPVVIYIGAVSDWFDYGLYEYGLAKLKDIRFVMIGPVSGVRYKQNLSNIQRFSKIYKNFSYLGPKPHCELKQYLANADVGVIPFQSNPMTQEINPIKLFEYAGFGVATIAPALTELQNYKENVLFYNTKEEYIDLIGRYATKKTDFAQKLLAFARDNTWEKRFENILGCMNR